jgi:crotonobetainyl-CoA:carnitine CoA-transferase CaiB-like acyl-CoA transferase
MSVTGPAPGEPTKVGVALVDVITGLHAVYGILAALHHRSVSGVGQHIEVNLLSSLLSAMVNQSAAQVAGGVTPGILGNDHPSITPYSVYATGDRQLIIAVGNDQQFRSAATVLGIAEMADDERFATNTARVAHRDLVRSMMEARLVTKGADHWYAELTKVGVPSGPINDIATAFGLATDLGLNPIVNVDGSPIPLVANPLQMSATPPTYRLAPPAMQGSTTSIDGA